MSDYERAQAIVKEIVAADPFFMQAYKNLAFWSLIGKKSKENGKDSIHESATRKFFALYNECPHVDLTGTIDTLASVFEGERSE